MIKLKGEEIKEIFEKRKVEVNPSRYEEVEKKVE